MELYEFLGTCLVLLLGYGSLLALVIYDYKCETHGVYERRYDLNRRRKEDKKQDKAEKEKSALRYM